MIRFRKFSLIVFIFLQRCAWTLQCYFAIVCVSWRGQPEISGKANEEWFGKQMYMFDESIGINTSIFLARPVNIYDQLPNP